MRLTLGTLGASLGYRERKIELGTDRLFTRPRR
jgi:hypothetical protein